MLRHLTGASPAQLADRGEHARQPSRDADARGRLEPGPRRIVDLAERSVAGRGSGHQDRGPVVVPVKGVDDLECGVQVLVRDVVTAE
jgi:hypothetical protein